MLEIQAAQKQDGRRLDRVVKAYAPSMPEGMIQKSLRMGKIRLNGAKAEASARVKAGDAITIDADERFLQPSEKPNRFLSGFKTDLQVIYEDENLIMVDKKPGMICHGDEREKVNTLINHIRAWLYQKGERPQADLCNRIDRFTGGIVIAAKNQEALKDMDSRIRMGMIRKYYLCVIPGSMRPDSGILENWLYQRPEERRVRVAPGQIPGAKFARTAYRTLKTQNGISLMECELLTGRTHQIRAQFAQTGHPLVGDAQYGSPEIGGRGCQTLYAWRVTFEKSGGMLDYLAGQSFRVRDVPFVREYFHEEDEMRR